MTLLERVYRLFAIRQRSEREIRDYFKIKNLKLKMTHPASGGKGEEQIPQVDIEKVIEILKSKGLINDIEFAKAWVESRRRSKKKGKIAMKAALLQKGIGREIIEEIVAREVDISEEDLATQALEKRLKRWENLESLEVNEKSLRDLKKKAVEFLMRRGFEFEVAKEVVEKILKKG